MTSFKKLGDDFKLLFDAALFPQGVSCVNCGAELPVKTRVALCSKCMANLHICSGRRCVICGVPLRNESDYCLNCMNYDKYFDVARAPLIYEDTAAELIKKLKYGNKRYIAAELAKLMTDEFLEQGLHADVVCCVPMTKEEQKNRGFNQAWLLAEDIAARLKLPLSGGLIKVRATGEQKQLTAAQRRKNLKDVFTVLDKTEFKDKEVLLVDDVFTTGATANECARALKRAKAKKVSVLCACMTRFELPMETNAEKSQDADKD